jgi:hypothetical protein
MAFKLDDRMRETAVAPGTGNVTTSAVVQGAVSFASILTSNGDTTWATLTNGTAWETNTFTRVSAGVYSRGATPFASSNAGALVNFSTGTIDFFCDLPGSKAKVLERLLWAAAAITPPANDGTALGTGALSFSDLFLALGGVINFNNGGITITEVSDALAFAGASAGYTFDQPLTFTSTLGAVRSKLVTFTRVLSAANNSVAYTGVGFKPSSIICTGGITSNSSYSMPMGIVDSARSGSSLAYFNSGNALTFASFIDVIDSAGTNEVIADVSSFDSDGFTLAWSKSNSPVGTATFYALCLR